MPVSSRKSAFPEKKFLLIYKNSIHLPKYLTTFLSFPISFQNLCNSSPKISDDLFSISCYLRKCLKKTGPLDAPKAGCPVHTLFFTFSMHLPILLRKLGRWMPPGWLPGAVAPFTPPYARHCNQWGGSVE